MIGSMRNFLGCFIIAVFCLFFSPIYAQDAISTPILTTVANFRDIAGISSSNGGTGFANATSNNGAMRTEVFYRSDALSLNGYGPYPAISNADWATISSLNIGEDIDLRTDNEIAANPERPPSGAVYSQIDIYGSNPPPAQPWTGTPAQMISWFEDFYSDFVTVSAEATQFGKVLLALAHSSNPVLFHCDSGKDRTGWTAAILESIAGVSSATIMKDYLASNNYLANVITTYKAQLQAQYPGADPNTIDAGVYLSSDYLNAALNQVTTSYGSMNAYLIQGLGLSQSDIYVLRAKMVYYQTLPGQSGFSGNAASGAGFLNALQNSSLSGSYTAFNYYLQSAIDAGTLGGVENQVGGQVYADTASFLLRRPQWIDEAARPYARCCDLDDSRTRIWMADLGGGFWTASSSSAASSTEFNAGTLIGATHRFDDHACADLGVGYNWGSVRSAGARATVNTVPVTIGGRYGFSGLEAGFFVAARADAGYATFSCTRSLDEGLGDATGKTNGAFYGGLIGLGDIISFAPFTFTLQTGLRVTGVALRSFDESGSELALGVSGIDKTCSSLLFELGVGFDRRQLGAWAITPALTLGYERLLTNSSVQSTGTNDGYSVIQYSAFDSRNLTKVGLSITGQRGASMVTAEVNGLIGDAGESTGINGQVSIKCKF